MTQTVLCKGLFLSFLLCCFFSLPPGRDKAFRAAYLCVRGVFLLVRIFGWLHGPSVVLVLVLVLFLFPPVRINKRTSNTNLPSMKQSNIENAMGYENSLVVKLRCW